MLETTPNDDDDARRRWHEAHPDSRAARRRAFTAELNTWTAFVRLVTGT